MFFFFPPILAPDVTFSSSRERNVPDTNFCPSADVKLTDVRENRPLQITGFHADTPSEGRNVTAARQEWEKFKPEK